MTSDLNARVWRAAFELLTTNVPVTDLRVLLTKKIDNNVRIRIDPTDSVSQILDTLVQTYGKPIRGNPLLEIGNLTQRDKSLLWFAAELYVRAQELFPHLTKSDLEKAIIGRFVRGLRLRRVKEETQKSLAEDPTDSLLTVVERATRNEDIYAALEDEEDGKTRPKPPCKKITDSVEQEDLNSIAKVNIEKQPDLRIELIRPVQMITGVCRIHGFPVEYELDTGATVSIIDEELYMRLTPRPELKPSEVRIVSATEAAFQMLGEIHVAVEFGNHII